MSVSYRYLGNGYMAAPRRGEPPPPPEGYEPIAGDPFVFAPIMRKCEFRERKIIQGSGCCQGLTEKFYCHKNNTYVSRYFCVGCKDA